MLLFIPLPHKHTPWSLQWLTPRPTSLMAPGPSSWDHPHLPCTLVSLVAWGPFCSCYRLGLAALARRTESEIAQGERKKEKKKLSKGFNKKIGQTAMTKQRAQSDKRIDWQLAHMTGPFNTPLCFPTLPPPQSHHHHLPPPLALPLNTP